MLLALWLLFPQFSLHSPSLSRSVAVDHQEWNLLSTQIHLPPFISLVLIRCLANRSSSVTICWGNWAYCAKRPSQHEKQEWPNTQQGWQLSVTFRVALLSLRDPKNSEVPSVTGVKQLCKRQFCSTHSNISGVGTTGFHLGTVLISPGEQSTHDKVLVQG